MKGIPTLVVSLGIWLTAMVTTQRLLNLWEAGHLRPIVRATLPVPNLHRANQFGNDVGFFVIWERCQFCPAFDFHYWRAEQERIAP